MTDSPSSLIKQLNKEQQFAVTHTEGPMLILAGAGSGKTRTITYKISYLIDQGLSSPERILAVTFTNKAAEEMRSRVLELVGERSSHPLISTFHSFAARTLRRYADLLGYGNDFTICDSDDQKSLYRRVYQELEFSKNDLPINRVQSMISRAKNHSPGAA